MTTREIIDGIEMLRFFNQRAGRELWGDKPKQIQDEDIEHADRILRSAISALEKQTPKKPLPKELAEQQPFGNNPVYFIPCGSCGEPLNFLFPYCPWCGQAIDWTEGEE